MTIKLPKKNVCDKFLSLIGKKRALRIPPGIYEKFGPYVYGQAEKESFWRALARRKSEDPPEGWVYPDEIIPGENQNG